MASTANGPAARPVMADVARLAGVSHQTVSRVLNDHPNVRPQTREDVLAAISELGYRPNAAARTLVTRRTHTLGVISFDTTLYGPASMLYGIEQAAQAGYFVAIASLPAFDRRSVLDAVDRLLGQGVEGIIVIAPRSRRSRRWAASPPRCRWSPSAAAPAPRWPRWPIDNIAGAVPGHPVPARPGPPDRPLRGRAATPRLDAPGAHRRLAARPCARRARAEPEIAAGDWSARSGYESVTSSPRCPRSPRCSAPTTRWRWACCGHGRARPAGARTTSAWSASTTSPSRPTSCPPLTTVRQDFGELGRRALRLLVDRIADAPAPRRPAARRTRARSCARARTRPRHSAHESASR